MREQEKTNFYKQDKKEYILNNKDIILEWINNFNELKNIEVIKSSNCIDYKSILSKPIKKIYDEIEDVQELQRIIYCISNWYEIKYPDCEFKFDGDKVVDRHETKTDLCKYMDIYELIRRLETKDLITCNYRSDKHGFIPTITNNRCIVRHYSDIRVKFKQLHEHMGSEQNVYIRIYNEEGIAHLNNTTYENYILRDILSYEHFKKGTITILELYNELIKSDKCICADDLRDTIIDRELRIIVRKHLLELIALKLLYSKNTIPEYGYERAKRFIKEFNEELNTNLETNLIDEIISKDYNDVKKLIK